MYSKEGKLKKLIKIT